MNKIIQLDIKKAILLPFSGKDWFLRLIVLSVLCLGVSNVYCKFDINNFIMTILIFLLLIFFGYFCQFAYNKFNNITPCLPSWKLDFIKYLRQGFIWLMGVFSYLFVISAFAFIFVPLIQIIHNNYLKILSDIVNQLVIIFIIFVVPCLYADKLNFRGILDFKKLVKTFLNTKLDFLLCFLISIVFGEIIKIILHYIKSSYMQFILIPLIFFITYLIVFDLFIQVFILSKEKEDS